ncbi:MAG: XRE family transcriptional regulator [Bacteroidia bacterium]|nr:XRE family transcriptional regulator [Bacteroidia bacterium]
MEATKLTLKAARVNAGMTQIEAAVKIGIAVETLANYEKGKTYPNAPIIKAMEKIYKVNYDQIIFSHDDCDV